MFANSKLHILCRSDYSPIQEIVEAQIFLYLVLSVIVTSYSISFIFFISISESAKFAQVFCDLAPLQPRLCAVAKNALMSSINS